MLDSSLQQNAAIPDYALEGYRSKKILTGGSQKESNIPVTTPVD